MLWSTLWLLQSGFNRAAGFLDLSLKNINKHKTVKTMFPPDGVRSDRNTYRHFLLSKMPETYIKLLMKLMNKTHSYNTV